MATEPASGAASQLAGYLGTIRRRKWTILLVTVLAVGAAIGLSKSQTPTYEASASVLLQNSTTSAQAALGISGSPTNVADEIARLHSPSVAGRVRAQLGSAPNVSASNASGTDVIRVTTTSTDPQEAAKVANAYAQAYVQQRQADAINTYLSAAKVVQDQINSLQTQLAALPRPPPNQPGAVNPQATLLESQIGLLQQEANTLQTQTALGAGGATVVQPATPPSSPSSPRTLRNALVGLAGGLVLGIALAFVRENLDDTIVTREDLDRAQPALPVLGLIPVVSGRDAKAKDLVSAARPHSFAAEAYRSLRTSVQFLGLDQPVKLLQITSPKSAEGKTTIVGNLALALAAAGQRVIAVDCDLRRSRLHSMMGLPNKAGFTSVLIGQTPIAAALQQVEGQENLSVLTSGERPPNPAELLSGTRAREVFGVLERLADIVIIDCPPVLPVTDAVLIAANVDATLMVVSSGTSTAKDLSNALDLLGQVDAPVAGVVLNSVSTNAGYRYRYSYSYEPRHSSTADRS